MRYEKPIVMSLNARARQATGESPLGCVAGPAAGGPHESCGSGGSATWGCITGGNASGLTSCMPGSAASVNGDCLGGTSVQYYCEAGTGGGDDPWGCNVGPFFSPI